MREITSQNARSPVNDSVICTPSSFKRYNELQHTMFCFDCHFPLPSFPLQGLVSDVILTFFQTLFRSKCPSVCTLIGCSQVEGHFAFHGSTDYNLPWLATPRCHATTKPERFTCYACIWGALPAPRKWSHTVILVARIALCLPPPLPPSLPPFSPSLSGVNVNMPRDGEGSPTHHPPGC